MKYSLAAVPALAAVALAQAGERPAFLNTAFDVKEGTPFTFQYSGCQDGCTIELRNGPSDNLKLVKLITADATGGSFTWTPEGIPSDTYTFQIQRTDKRGDPNYSVSFPYQGTGAVSSAATSPATSLTTAASSAASSASSAATVVSSGSASVTMSTVGRETTASTPTGRNGTASSTGSSSTRPSTSAVTNIPTAGVGRVSVPLALAGVAAAMAYFF